MSSLTPHGRETLHSNPDRVLGVNEEVEAFGCHVLAQYALLGHYDFMTIIDAPDHETVAHMSVDLGSRGTVNIITMVALELESFRAKLKGSDQLAAAPVVGGETATGAQPQSSAQPGLTGGTTTPPPHGSA